MTINRRWAWVLLLLGFLDGRLAVSIVSMNGLPFPPEIRLPMRAGEKEPEPLA